MGGLESKASGILGYIYVLPYPFVTTIALFSVADGQRAPLSGQRIVA
jgi:hypothetical protein